MVFRAALTLGSETKAPCHLVQMADLGTVSPSAEGCRLADTRECWGRESAEGAVRPEPDPIGVCLFMDLLAGGRQERLDGAFLRMTGEALSEMEIARLLVHLVFFCLSRVPRKYAFLTAPPRLCL